MKKHSISISGSNTWMATVRLAADKATLDASWTNYFTECKSKGRAYFKSKIKSVGKRGARPGQLPPPAGAAHANVTTTHVYKYVLVCVQVQVQCHTVVTRTLTKSVTLISATALWDPWDASPPTLEITGTKCIWSPPTFAAGCRLSLDTVGSLLPQNPLLNLTGKGKKSRDERSPPTFQP